MIMQIKRWVKENFSFPFASFSASIYAPVVYVLNQDKEMAEMVLLIFQQCTLSFLLVGILAKPFARILQRVSGVWAYVIAIASPTCIVTVASLANWYTTGEVKNTVGPLSVSFTLNTLYTFCVRSGQLELREQLAFVLMIVTDALNEMRKVMKEFP